MRIRTALFLLCTSLWQTPYMLAQPPPIKAPVREPVTAHKAAPVKQDSATKTSAPSSGEMSVADLTARVRDSIVVISVMGRDGERSSLGAGFALTKNGLIATNLHVIGEARPIVVTTADAR